MIDVRTIDLGGTSLAVHERGRACEPALVLVHGLAQTQLDWPDALLEALAASVLRVVAFDNRDIGRSTRHEQSGSPPLLRLMLATKLRLPWSPRPPYQLEDMGADLLGLLDALGIERAHLVGLSTGGMIAQRLALARPDRVASLTCIMSSSGAPSLPGPCSDVARRMRERASDDLDQEVARELQLRALIAGDLTDLDAAELRHRVRRSIHYGWPVGEGPLRQYTAILADRSRWRLLGRLSCPTLVLHGDRDPLLPPDHGRDLVARVPGARFQLIEGMGHEITHSHERRCSMRPSQTDGGAGLPDPPIHRPRPQFPRRPK